MQVKKLFWKEVSKLKSGKDEENCIMIKERIGGLGVGEDNVQE